MKEFATKAEAIAYVEERDNWLGWELIEVVTQGDVYGVLADKYPVLEDGQVDVVAKPWHVPLDAVVWTLDLFESEQKTLFPRADLGFYPH